ncbi:ACP S-malonyltransferase [Mycobacterium attenuatum]|uniref:ACP S-malonyltransferase n=1 Tax=Mycobacterium attenuatum TaxID=2341086 RepID=UPI000F1BB2AE|nr:ACP S-malonyltransferase [Mycobacterium attenuatum]VBA62414.1 Malonyl CoA-acyl carrier protein transacylase [Mycobacterium attenuatum]
MLAFIFPGQGSQVAAMGKALADRYPIARQTFEEADDVLGRALSQTCFSGEDLDLTVNAQPALLTTSVAAYRVLTTETGLHPTVMAGHSLGEISALTCAGSTEFASALSLVQQRAVLMQQAVPPAAGAMLAIMGLAQDAVAEICSTAAQTEIVEIANHNGSGQLVVSGHADAVQRANALATDRGAVTRKLAVSAPFHCQLMQSAATQLADRLADIEFLPPRVPIIECSSGTIVRTGSGIAERIAAQVSAPVRWDKVMNGLAALKIDTTIEVGAGKSLSSLLRRERSVAHTMVCANPDDVSSLGELAERWPILQRPLGYWQIDDHGHSVNGEDLLVMWAGADTAEKVDNTRWAAGRGGAWMRRYGTMARISAQGTLQVFDSEHWLPREDGAYVRRDGSCIIKPDAEIEEFAAQEWLVSTAGTMSKTDGTRIIWADGQEWNFDGR